MASIRHHNWLFMKRIVRFGDIDSAGVVHFYHLMRWCHEAWEESLNKYGLNVIDIFPSVAMVILSTLLVVSVILKTPVLTNTL